jgi:glycosyltransferase involved in cell wall biosynthesis
MAGPAIRTVELAKVLSRDFEVILLIPNQADIAIAGVALRHHSEAGDVIKGAHAFICQHLDIINGFKALFSDMLIIVDGYDPEPLEHIELFKEQVTSKRESRMKRLLLQIDFDFALADLMLAASPRQKDLWLGYSIASGRLTHEDRLEIREMPFGCPEEFLPVTTADIRKRFSIKEDEIVLIWGGGIWNWFDPLTLLQAVKRAKDEGVKIKLIFMGVRHPNDLIGEMEMVRKAVSLAKELRVYEQEVYFHFGWTPYEERVQFYSVAHIGVSTHFYHLETRFSFRTRLLDYFWAGLPVIVTQVSSSRRKMRRRYFKRL